MPITKRYVWQEKITFPRSLERMLGTHLLNTAPDPPQFSACKCEELALFFNNKITSSRDSITADVNTDDLSKSYKNDATMGKFTCITLTELCKTVTECNSSTSCIDPVPTAF